MAMTVIVGLISILSLSVVLFFCSYEHKNRKKLFVTAAFLVINYSLLLCVFWLVDTYGR